MIWKGLFKIFARSFLAKVTLVFTLLMIGSLGIQTFVFIQLEIYSLENTLIENKKDYTELLATNLGEAQIIGGFAFQSQLIEKSAETKDTIFVRFVKPNDEIYLSNIAAEKGTFVEDLTKYTEKIIIKDEVYKGEQIKVVISPASGGYTVWLGFSLKTIQHFVNLSIFSRIIVFIVILGIGIIFTYFLARISIKPIKRLSDIVKEVGQGNLDVKMNIKSEDEIGALSKSFESMCVNLQERTKKLTEANKALQTEIIERKRAEEALKEYSEHLEEMVEERAQELQAAQEQLVRREKLAVLGQLAATVSHEIRNPLGTIRISAYAIENKTLNKGLGIERALDCLQRNITRCDNIIGELLDYARKPDLNPQPVRFDDWLNRVLDEQIPPEGITLSREIASGVEIWLDPERFRRVIINLVDNARQAMLESPEVGNKARVISVQSRVIADRLKIVISDTGPGIPPDVMSHIFEPLYSTKSFGVGLGLWVVKGIVEQHGGELEISSKADEGTQVIVWLPLTRQGD